MTDMPLPTGVLWGMLSKLSLWDARSLQHAHPELAQLVHEHVSSVVARAMRTRRPSFIDAFLKSQPGFQERVHGSVTMMRTPHDITMHMSCGCGVLVVLRVLTGRRPWARIEVRTTPPPPAGRPGFGTLRKTLQALWWCAQALAERGIEPTFRTRAMVHHPPSEVLNTLATAFVERHCGPAITSGTGGP